MAGLQRESSVKFFVLIVFVGMMGCNPALKHAEIKYPNCQVESVDDNTVRVKCPGQEPFEKKFRKGR